MIRLANALLPRSSRSPLCVFFRCWSVMGNLYGARGQFRWLQRCLFEEWAASVNTVKNASTLQMISARGDVWGWYFSSAVFPRCVCDVGGGRTLGSFPLLLAVWGLCCLPTPFSYPCSCTCVCLWVSKPARTTLWTNTSAFFFLGSAQWAKTFPQCLFLFTVHNLNKIPLL